MRVFFLKAHRELRLYNSLFTADPHSGFRLAPDQLYESTKIPGCGVFTFSTNSQGIREKGPVTKKKPGEFRVLVTGDSFTYGICVNWTETFTVRAENKLQDKGYIQVRMINASSPSWGTRHALGYLRGYGDKFDPDLVVHAYYPNDTKDNVTDFRYVDGALFTNPTLIGGHVSFLVEFLKMIRGQHQSFGQAEAVTESLLEDMNDWAKRRQAPLLLLRLPSRPATRWRLNQERAEMDKPLMAEGIPQKGVWHEMQAAPEDPYWPEHHFNVLGHEITADVLAPWIEEYLPERMKKAAAPAEEIPPIAAYTAGREQGRR